jgi:hypothetical protein
LFAVRPSAIIKWFYWNSLEKKLNPPSSLSRQIGRRKLMVRTNRW